MLSEVHRVLRPDGRFVAELGGHGNIAAIRVAFAAVLKDHGLGSLGERGNYYPTAETYSSQLERHGFTVEKATLFPRPTPLNESGMAGWLNTFYRGALDALPEDLRETAVKETVALLSPVLLDHDGHWTADYVRLRFVARV
jgi:SAM-dependent methyltransferase